MEGGAGRPEGPRGSSPTAAPGGAAPTLWDREPFSTFRAHPRRFGIGLPAVFLGALAAGLLLAPVHLSLAAAALLAIQTGGFVALYWPVAGMSGVDSTAAHRDQQDDRSGTEADRGPESAAREGPKTP